MISVLIPSTPERKDRLAFAVESIQKNICNQPIEIITEISTGEGANKPLLRMFEKVNDLVFLLNDDVILMPHCIQELYNNYVSTFPDKDGICVPNDGVHNCKLATFPFGHVDTFKKYWCKDYIHLYADSDITEVMKRRNRYSEVPTAKLIHKHFLFEKELMDDTYGFSQKFSGHDQLIFRDRLEHNFYL